MSLRSAFEMIFRGWFGDVYPSAAPIPLVEIDAREHALRRFADFISELEFANPESMKEPTFTIPRANVLTKQPADPTQLKFPSVAFRPMRGTHDNYSNGAPDDSSFDVFAPGTMILKLGEYVETFSIEVWGAHDAVRTSILAGIVDAMRTGAWSQATLLALPDYFGITARFTLMQSEHIDDPDVVRGRVRAMIYVLLEVPEVKLVHAVTFKPYFRLEENPTTPIER